MKARQLPLWFLLIPFLAGLSGCHGDEVRLDIRGPFPGKVITLKALDPETMSYMLVDTMSADDNGRALFSFPFDKPNIYFLSFEDIVHLHLSVVGPGRIRAEHNGTGVRIKGSPQSEDIATFDSRLEALRTKHLGKIEASLQQSMISNDQDGIALNQAILDTAMRSFTIDFRDMVDAAGINPAGFYALQFSNFSRELGYLELKLREFEAELPDSPVTLMLAKQLEQHRATMIGNTPPYFEAIDREGMPVNPDMFLGNYLFIDFWASWCPPCRTENPLIAEVYEKYIAYGFQILSIAPMRSEADWQSAIDNDGVGAWPHILDEHWEISEQFRVHSLPQNFLLNEEGRIIARNISAEELDALLADAFGEG